MGAKVWEHEGQNQALGREAQTGRTAGPAIFSVTSE